MLDELPLFPIEYEGMRSTTSYVGKPNPGIEYINRIRPDIRNWCAKTVPALDPTELTTRIIASAYGKFRIAGKPILDEIRLEYAVHYHNNCVTSHSYGFADRWNEVIDALS